MRIDSMKNGFLKDASSFFWRHQWLISPLLLVLGAIIVLFGYVQYSLWHEDLLSLPANTHGVAFGRGSTSVVLQRLVSGWLTFEPWNGGSINFIHGGRPDTRFTFLLFVATSLGVAIVLALMFAGRRLPSRLLITIGALVVAGWLIADARWQWNVWLQLGATGRQFSGKSWEGKHFAAQDRDVFSFIQAVKARLPLPPVRVLYFAGEPYENGRGNYYLYPHNVLSYNYGVGAVPMKRHFRDGDYVVLYRQGAMSYDLKSGVLSWNGGRLRAELVYSNAGNMLLKVI
jgi:hypothetical protein